MFRSTGVAVLVSVVAAGLLSGCGNTHADHAAASSTPAVAQVNSSVQVATAGAPLIRCGVDLSSPTIGDAIAKLPVEPVTHAPWDTNPASFEGNFNPCATLSTAIVTIQGATGSSPNQALMFHSGRYLGTATSKAYGFTSLAAAATTDDTVALNYKTSGSCNACSDGTLTQVKFHWDGTHVVMIGRPPH
ncbi:LppP/LprE family lipoprotein [Nocardia miyunensis]|uniref:LppP/LprE family lipoprotein n=1 Tax=Nocardia miyunensis TaxID=282684 RepID=UPI000832F27F|nr:LppP/LprE family lipoprotein [Nocardia miyunensis]